MSFIITNGDWYYTGASLNSNPHYAFRFSSEEEAERMVAHLNRRTGWGGLTVEPEEESP